MVVQVIIYGPTRVPLLANEKERVTHFILLYSQSRVNNLIKEEYEHRKIDKIK